MIPDYPRLNFPAVKLRISQRGEQMTVWDPLRGIYLVLTPEEWVRRHLIGFLISHCGAQPMRIVQEYAVAMNGSPQRADVVVVGAPARPRGVPVGLSGSVGPVRWCSSSARLPGSE